MAVTTKGVCVGCGAVTTGFMIGDVPDILCRGCLDKEMATRRPTTLLEVNPDGTRTLHIASDATHAAAMLDYDGAPELSQEEFGELTGIMRKVREETSGEGSA